MTRVRADYDQVLVLPRRGLSATDVARETGIPRRTVHDWQAGRVPAAFSAMPCGCREHRFHELPADYIYLLALYLGDGYLARHRRGVRKLRVSLDAKYPAIVRQALAAMRAVMPDRSAGVQHYAGHVEVYSYARRWACLLPQDGAGVKHERPIKLEDWQRLLVESAPQLFLRGLIHSDGCRNINTGTNWRNPRYSFSKRSADIRDIFAWACDLLDLHWTTAPYTVYVSRKADVARMDQFIGPKS